MTWTLYLVALVPMVVGIGWEIVEGSVLPRLIPRAEIERLVEEIFARFPMDPEEAAFAEEHAAWCRSNSLEQGKWKRVRKIIRRRLTRLPS